MNKVSTAIRTLLATNMLTNATREQVFALVDSIKQPVSALTDETRPLLPSLKGGAMFDTLSDDIIIHIPDFNKATKAEQTTINVPAHDVVFKLPSYDVETVRYFSLALAGLIAKQPDYNVVWNDACKLTALVDYVVPILQGETELIVLKRASLSEELDFSVYGLAKAMFITDKPRYFYNMPNNGGIKIYLKNEHRRSFDDLCDNGFLSAEYGRNLVKDGDFVNSYAVLIPAKNG